MLTYKSSNLSKFSNLKHFFFTRLGGVSQGDYSSLNVSYKNTDSEENTNKNFDLIAGFLKIPREDVFTLNQVHSNNFCIIDEPSNYLTVQKIEADSLITKRKNIFIGVVTADCCPILVIDKTSNIIAAIHAGSKGALNSVIENTLKKMLELGANIDTTVVSMGPSLKAHNYEVRQDFLDTFLNVDKDYINFFEKQKESYLFNLPEFIFQKLLKFGIKTENIEEIKIDTMDSNNVFFSHRYSTKNKIQRGLQLSGLMLC